VRTFAVLGAGGLWGANAVLSYGHGASFAAIGIRGTIVSLAVALGCLCLSLVRPTPVLGFLAAAFPITILSALFIQGHAFLHDFHPGRPLFNIQHALRDLLLHGHWIYVYHGGLSPAYPPAIVFSYAPAVLLNIDPRWLNLVATLLLLSVFLRATSAVQKPQTAFTAAAFFLSPAYLYQAETTQLPPYWFMLALLGLAAGFRARRSQDAWLLLACLARPLAWAMLISRLAMGGTLDVPVRATPVRRRRRAIPAVIAVVVALATIICIAVDPRAFYWCTLIYPYADGNHALAGGIPQPSHALALTPLLPFVGNKVLLLGAQLLAVCGITGVLWRIASLRRNVAYAFALVYATFLILNFQVYNYYWIDVLVLIVAASVFGANRVSTTSESQGSNRPSAYLHPYSSE
jgi:hypothetical protein